MNNEQRANLKMLADYLSKLPRNYKKFNIHNYYRVDNKNLSYGSVLDYRCGTSACAVGHGPAAGIKINFIPNSHSSVSSWNDYCEAAFGVECLSREYYWLFSEVFWPNSNHFDAAKRINQFLSSGVPDSFDHEAY